MTSRASLRCRILAVIDASPVPLSAFDIAQRAGIPYKPTIDALNALHNRERIKRCGRKFSARWCALHVGQDDGAAGWAGLAACWFGVRVFGAT